LTGNRDVDVPFIPRLCQSCNAAECNLADLDWEGVAGVDGGEERVPAIGYEEGVEEGEVEVDEALSVAPGEDPLEDCVIFCGGGGGLQEMRIFERDGNRVGDVSERFEETRMPMVGQKASIEM
jgi:hypothetical protein